ncbi:MAG TPA: FAD-binding protein [Nakamurella multipartita]|nr:FAD-binding protein [Nakamurella multipartita]
MTIHHLARPRIQDRAVAHSLRGLCAGDVQLPGDPGYDAARQAWNLAVDQRPAAVARPADARQTAQVVRAAAAAGLRVAPQTTGHNAGPLGRLDDVVIVRTGAMNSVQVDPDRQGIRVGGGTLWLTAVTAAAAHGRAVLHGSAPDVGIAGYSLGGGLGWYARALGLQTNNVTAVEVVTADGALVRADAEQNTELFWALRGGSGNFGIVTALEFRTFPFATTVAGMLVWDAAMAEPVLRRWVQWAGDAPDEVTTSLRVMSLPPLPEIPAPFRGRSLLIIDGAVLASDARSAEILAPLRDLQPEVDTFARVPAETLSGLHMDPDSPMPSVSDTAILDAMPEAAIETFLDLARPGSGSSLMMHELRQLGGALARPHPGAGAMPTMPGAFLAFGGALAATPEMAAAGRRDAQAFAAALAPFGSGRTYLNFQENQTETAAGFDPVNYGRLVALKSALDPQGVLLGNHPVRRTYEVEDEFF